MIVEKELDQILVAIAKEIELTIFWVSLHLFPDKYAEAIHLLAHIARRKVVEDSNASEANHDLASMAFSQSLIEAAFQLPWTTIRLPDGKVASSVCTGCGVASQRAVALVRTGTKLG